MDFGAAPPTAAETAAHDEALAAAAAARAQADAADGSDWRLQRLDAALSWFEEWQADLKKAAKATGRDPAAHKKAHFATRNTVKGLRQFVFGLKALLVEIAAVDPNAFIIPARLNNDQCEHKFALARTHSSHNANPTSGEYVLWMRALQMSSAKQLKAMMPRGMNALSPSSDEQLVGSSFMRGSDYKIAKRPVQHRVPWALHPTPPVAAAAAALQQPTAEPRPLSDADAALERLAEMPAMQEPARRTVVERLGAVLSSLDQAPSAAVTSDFSFAARTRRVLEELERSVAKRLPQDYAGADDTKRKRQVMRDALHQCCWVFQRKRYAFPWAGECARAAGKGEDWYVVQWLLHLWFEERIARWWREQVCMVVSTPDAAVEAPDEDESAKLAFMAGWVLKRLAERGSLVDGDEHAPILQALGTKPSDSRLFVASEANHKFMVDLDRLLSRRYMTKRMLLRHRCHLFREVRQQLEHDRELRRMWGDVIATVHGELSDPQRKAVDVLQAYVLQFLKSREKRVIPWMKMDAGTGEQTLRASLKAKPPSKRQRAPVSDVMEMEESVFRAYLVTNATKLHDLYDQSQLQVWPRQRHSSRSDRHSLMCARAAEAVLQAGNHHGPYSQALRPQPEAGVLP